MQIKPVCYNEYYHNKVMPKNYSKSSDVCFCSIKQPLVGVVEKDFKTETAKKLYSKIHKFSKLLKSCGNIKDVKIFSENLEFCNQKLIDKFAINVDTTMSIRRDCDKVILALHRVYPSKTKDCVLEAAFDRHGQMMSGQYHIGHMNFERNQDNVRKITCGERTFIQQGYDDRKWGLTAENCPILQNREDNSALGLFEIFIELARLNTSLFK